MQTRLKLATYNIHRCYGSDGVFDPARVTQVIQQLDTDIIALQEVETFVDGGQNILDMFATAAGFITIAGPTMERGDSSYGNAVLTRHRPQQINKLDISIPGREPRGAVSLHFTIQGQLIHILTTHLGLKAGERQLQMQQLVDFMTRRPADVTVLMGDINEWFPWGKVSRQLTRQFGNSTLPATFPTHLPLFSLDQIRCLPANAISTTRKLVTSLSKKASDHLPVYTTLRIQTG
ncbi:MAG: endonuclease/exonuclease/phosphatase family protein [Gammaproteobacteria bacterium]|jgi:endonuclease/exonuclease/phosphatase family metal-dependent hydrolase